MLYTSKNTIIIKLWQRGVKLLLIIRSVNIISAKWLVVAGEVEGVLANGGQTVLEVDGEGLWPWRADVRHSRPARTGTLILVPLTCGNILQFQSHMKPAWLHFIQPRFGIVSFYHNKVFFFTLSLNTGVYQGMR